MRSDLFLHEMLPRVLLQAIIHISGGHLNKWFVNQLFTDPFII